jgi:hypothetical protein
LKIHSNIILQYAFVFQVVSFLRKHLPPTLYILRNWQRR